MLNTCIFIFIFYAVKSHANEIIFGTKTTKYRPTYYAKRPINTKNKNIKRKPTRKQTTARRKNRAVIIMS